MGLERTEYYRSPLLSLRYVRCRSAEKRMSSIEESEANTLVLPLRGVFVEHFSSGRQVVAEPNIGLICPRGTSSRVSHPVDSQDDCLAIDYSSECFSEMAGSAARVAGMYRLLSPSMMAARNLLWHRLARDIADALEIEEIAVGILSYCAQSLCLDSSYSRRNAKMRELVETAKVVLVSHPEKSWSLASLATALGCSPFHLTRMFRTYIGVPLHRYQMHTRLARAFDLLFETDLDLTSIALEAGFNSHSHFTSLFRRWIGFTPRQIREAMGTQRLKARKILTKLLAEPWTP